MSNPSHHLAATRQTQSHPFIVPVFIPHHGCPHRCVFCNQRAITGEEATALNMNLIRQGIETFLGYRQPKHDLVQISFFGGNFLGLNADSILSLLDLAAQYCDKGQSDCIRFSTRPDTITRKNLALLESYPVRTVELGVQSMHAKVLTMANRGHTVNDTLQAVARLKPIGYQIGLQMMVGLPGDTTRSLMETARRLIGLQPDFIRIYPTLVLAGSPLAHRYRQGQYQPLDLADCVDLVKELFLLFQANRIPVIRMGLQASPALDDGATVLAGPYHPAFGHLVHAKIFLDRMRSLLKKQDNLSEAVRFFVHPRNISRARGLGNENIGTLQEEFRIHQLNILPDPALEMDAVRLA